MRQHRARAVGQIALAVAVWSSCLPAVSACDLSTFTTSCDSSQRVLIGVVAAGVVICIFLLVFGVCLRRRLRQRRGARLSHAPYDGIRRRSSNPPKPQRAPVRDDLLMYYQGASSAPPPVYIPYPPRGYDTWRSHSRPQSTSYAVREPPTPLYTASRPIPSSTLSRPISSLDTTSLSLRSSTHREGPTTNGPPTPSSPLPVSPRGTQTNVAEFPLHLLPSSPPPRSPTVAIPPASAPSPRPSGAIPPSSMARPPVLAPIHTGTTNLEEPPPAYTPI